MMANVDVATYAIYMLLACVQYRSLSFLCDLTSSVPYIPSCCMASGFQTLCV